MKILYYSSHPQLGLRAQSGPGTHMRETINAIRSLGHDVYPVIMGDELQAAAPAPEAKTNEGKNSKSFIKMLIPKIIWRSLKELKLLRTDKFAEQVLLKKMDEYRPDLVYERGAYLQLSGVNVAGKKNVLHFMELNAPFIDEVRDFEQARTLWLKKAKHAETQQVKCPDVVYVVSSALKNYYAGYISSPSKIMVMPNSVNPYYLIVNQVSRKNFMNEFQLRGKRVIGFVGSIFPYHGVDILIRAFHAVSKEFDDVMLMIVGDGSILKDLKKLSAGLGMNDRIIFTGSKPHQEVFTLIDMMDICVMAKSNWYGSPVKIFEYGAMGKAIIAPNTVPVNDVMIHNSDGLLIEPVEAELKQALETLLRDSDLKEKLALNFKEKVLRNYTWTKAAERIIADYKSITAKNNKP